MVCKIYFINEAILLKSVNILISFLTIFLTSTQVFTHQLKNNE
jgi:hypothetical protein